MVICLRHSHSSLALSLHRAPIFHRWYFNWDKIWIPLEKNNHNTLHYFLQNDKCDKSSFLTRPSPTCKSSLKIWVLLNHNVNTQIVRVLLNGLYIYILMSQLTFPCKFRDCPYPLLGFLCRCWMLPDQSVSGDWLASADTEPTGSNSWLWQ